MLVLIKYCFTNTVLKSCGVKKKPSISLTSEKPEESDQVLKLEVVKPGSIHIKTVNMKSNNRQHI